MLYLNIKPYLFKMIIFILLYDYIYYMIIFVNISSQFAFSICVRVVIITNVLQASSNKVLPMSAKTSQIVIWETFYHALEK